MAVGIIIGGAFGTIVKSLVDDVIMPPIGYLTSGVNFKGPGLDDRPAEGRRRRRRDAIPPSINYGSFINSVITFLIVAWAVFLLIKAMNVAETRLRLGASHHADAPPPPEDMLLLRQIRDELKKA